jgi:hypothetical protein
VAHQLESRVDKSLRMAASEVVSVGEGAWRLSFVNGSAVLADARITDRWLEVSAPLVTPRLPARDDLAWLGFNAELEGTARIARRLRDRVTRVVVDVETGRDDNIADRVVAACGHLAAALHAIQGAPIEAGPVDASPPRAAVADIERACHEYDWPCSVTDGGARVDLATRAGVFAATLESSRLGDDRAVVQLADLSAFAPISQQAAVALLLAASGAMRLVKGAIRRPGGAPPVAVLISPVVAPLGEPIGQTLDLALSALAAACQICAREVRALEDTRLASAYLGVWNPGRRHDSSRVMEEDPCLQQR